MNVGNMLDADVQPRHRRESMTAPSALALFGSNRGGLLFRVSNGAVMLVLLAAQLENRRCVRSRGGSRTEGGAR